MTPPRLRDGEVCIAEEMTGILDYLSRIQQGLAEGNWWYARDKIPGLVRRAEALGRRLTDELERTRSSQQARPAVVDAAIRSYARHYRAGRALYPLPPTANGTTPERDPAGQ